MKTKTIRNDGLCSLPYPYKVYTHKIGRHKFVVELYDDGSGHLMAKIGKNTLICRADATLEDWLDEAEEMSDFYHNIVDFLKEVRYLRSQEHHNLCETCKGAGSIKKKKD
jgi:hypothetical protein